MEKFYKLFLNKLKFSYDSFDRIVVNGYITSFHKVSNLSHYFKEILGYTFINKQVLFSVTEAYKQRIEAYAREQHLSCEYVDNKEREEGYHVFKAIFKRSFETTTCFIYKKKSFYM